MTYRPFYRRRFLNRRGHHAGAYVLADISLDTWRPAERAPRQSVEATLTIADCSRVGTLDFCADKPVELRNALHKAQVLREVVADFADALERAADEVGSGSPEAAR